MASNLINSFSYIAFDNHTKVILSYGHTAIDALDTADRLAPEAEIYILNAGVSGWKIWNRKMDLIAAEKKLRQRWFSF